MVMRRHWRVQPTSALMALTLIGLILINGYNLMVSVADASYASTLNLAYPPLLRIVVALGWVSVFCGLLIGLVRNWWRARRWVAPLFTIYGLWSVIWLIVFARSDYAHGRIAFQAAITVVLLLPFWWLHSRHA